MLDRTRVRVKEANYHSCLLALLVFLGFGGGILVLGGVLAFFLAGSLLRFYLLFVGGLVVIGIAVGTVYAASTDPREHCEGCGLGLGLLFAGNGFGWLIGLIFGSLAALVLRTRPPRR